MTEWQPIETAPRDGKRQHVEESDLNLADRYEEAFARIRARRQTARCQAALDEAVRRVTVGWVRKYISAFGDDLSRGYGAPWPNTIEAIRAEFKRIMEAE